MPVDYRKYPPNWRSEIVPRILKRAGDCCEFCDIENGINVYSASIESRNQVSGNWGYRQFWFESKKEMGRVKDMIKSSKIIKVVLTIAHLDHDESNHKVSDDRLKALCQYCHLNYDIREKVKRKKAENQQESLGV